MIYHYIKQVDVDALCFELCDYAVTSINIIGDNVYIELETTLSEQRKLELDALIDCHDIDKIMLNKAKNNKLLELRDACNKQIMGGFVSSASGVEEHYAYDYEDQINMTCIITNILMDAEYVVYWRNSTQVFPTEWTQEQFKALYFNGLDYKKALCIRLYGMRQDVDNCITISDVLAIHW